MDVSWVRPLFSAYDGPMNALPQSSRLHVASTLGHRSRQPSGHASEASASSSSFARTRASGGGVLSSNRKASLENAVAYVREVPHRKSRDEAP